MKNTKNRKEVHKSCTKRKMRRIDPIFVTCWYHFFAIKISFFKEKSKTLKVFGKICDRKNLLRSVIELFGPMGFSWRCFWCPAAYGWMSFLSLASGHWRSRDSPERIPRKLNLSFSSFLLFHFCPFLAFFDLFAFFLGKEINSGGDLLRVVFQYNWSNL